MAATDWDEATFEGHRALLFSIAYRMLGSASEAEDVVQDAWLRALQDEHADVRSPRAYLTTIVTRLCIDHLRSAERTRMEYPGPWLPEPLAEPNQESVELASSLTTAFLVLLEQLAPTERAVFLLRSARIGSRSSCSAMPARCTGRRRTSSSSRSTARPVCSCAIRSPATAPTHSTSPTAAFARSTSCATPTSCVGSSRRGRARHDPCPQ